MGGPFPSPLASMIRSGMIPSCSWAKNVPVRPIPACTSSTQRSAPDLERELCGCLRKRGLEWDHAALAEHGLEQQQRGVAGRRKRGLERLDVVRAGERDPGHERPEALPLRRLPVAERAPSVRPWNPPSSATIRVRPVALRAILSAASLASAPELQKKAHSAGNARESSAASRSIGSVQ